MNTKTDNQPSDSAEANKTAGGDCVSRLVRPSITSGQRSAFRQWSEALAGLSDADKESEAEAWIASALGILVKTNSVLFLSLQNIVPARRGKAKN